MILYASYTNLPPHAPYCLVLEGPQSIELGLSTASIFKHVTTQIHMAGKPDEPLIEIIAITKEPVTSEMSKQIGQEVVNFLMQSGHLPFRTG